MPRSYRELVDWSKTHEGKKLIRYTLGSVYTTIFSQIVIFVTYGFHLISGVVAATLVANLLGTIPSYHLNRRWAWKKKGSSHWRKEVIPYWSMSITGISFSMLGALLTKHIIHTHHLSHAVDTGLVAFVNLVSFAIFWVLKMLVFNKIFKTDKLHDIDEHLSAEEHAVSKSTGQ